MERLDTPITATADRPVTANRRLARDLARYGPQALAPRPSLAESSDYCRRLARSHYENFTVGSRLLPRHLRRHFFHIYAYCRWADDLADEVDSSEASLALLDWWESQLDECYAGIAAHPVFVALGESIREFDLPREPFADLLVAFRRDQQLTAGAMTRFETMAELEEYCRCSANPVGRLLLYLDRHFGASQVLLADLICTGLQLVNFWQDVQRDHARGRIYIPAKVCQRFGYTDEMFARGEANPAFRQMLAALVEQAETMLRAGFPLCEQVSRTMRIDVELFIRGGLAVAEAIRRADFDVWQARPRVSKLAKLGLLARCFVGSRKLGVAS